jgi:hypothetical protein
MQWTLFDPLDQASGVCGGLLARSGEDGRVQGKVSTKKRNNATREEQSLLLREIQGNSER